MFGKLRAEKPSIEDEPIDKVLETLRQYDTESEEFATSLSHLERLSALKAARQRRVSPDTLANIGASLLGILLIVAYEQKHVMTTKAMGFLPKAK